MIRKLQQTGRLYFLTVPTEWAVENRLKKGSELFCEYSKNTIAYSITKRSGGKLEIKLNESNPEGLIHLVIGTFESGAEEINIILNKKLEKKEIDYIKDHLFNNYSLTMVDVEPNKIHVSLLAQQSSIEDTFKTIMNSVINICRAALLQEDNLVVTHERQVQFFRFTMKRLVISSREIPSWSLIAESLGLISRAVFEEYKNKDYTKFFSKLLDVLQRLMKNKDSIDELVLMFNDLAELKKLTFINDKIRQHNLDRCYRSATNIVRELIKVNLSNKIV